MERLSKIYFIWIKRNSIHVFYPPANSEFSILSFLSFFYIIVPLNRLLDLFLIEDYKELSIFYILEEKEELSA
jgi:hypothetical protein